MTSIATSGATETMAYDAFGRRVQKVVPSGPTYNYIYDASGRLATVYSTSVGWYKDNVFAGSGSAIIASENASAGACTTCYYTTDHLGSTRMLTDQYGDAVTRHDYMPFGVEISANTYSRGSTFGSTTDVIEKFTGQIRDQEAGLDYFNARFFTPAVGRFNSVDPGNAGGSLISSQSWNAYSYALNDPCDLVDPAGLAPTPCKFNVSIKGGNLYPGQLQKIQNEMNRILGTDSSGTATGLSVGVSATNPNFTATLDEANLLTGIFGAEPGHYGENSGASLIQGNVSSSADIYMYNLRADYSSSISVATARTIVHEMLHYEFNLAGHPLPLGTNIFDMNPQNWLDHASQASLSPLQAQTLYHNCRKGKQGPGAGGVLPPSYAGLPGDGFDLLGLILGQGGALSASGAAESVTSTIEFVTSTINYATP